MARLVSSVRQCFRDLPFDKRVIDGPIRWSGRIRGTGEDGSRCISR
nr:MAG TPA: hypothetical protein [Caudoviricetes sp.]